MVQLGRGPKQSALTAYTRSRPLQVRFDAFIPRRPPGHLDPSKRGRPSGSGFRQFHLEVMQFGSTTPAGRRTRSAGGVEGLLAVRCDPMFFYADILFAYARNAYSDIGKDKLERDGDQMPTVPAIIFSVTALEAFINEVGALAVRNASVFSVTPEARVFAAEWEENGGGSPLRSKFIRAKHILTPEDYNLKATPFRDFSHLLTLRDALVHMTPREETKIEDGRIKIEPWQWVDKHLGPKGILVDCDPTENNWVYRITTKAVARWACTTTEAMIETLIQGVQDYRLRLDLHSDFEGAFALSPASTDSS